MDRGAWWATDHGVAKSQTRLERLSTHAQGQSALPHSASTRYESPPVPEFSVALALRSPPAEAPTGLNMPPAH